MEEIKEEKVEEKKTKKKKKKSWILVTILVILLLIAAAVGGYLAGASKIADLVVKQKNDVEEVDVVKEDTTTKEDTPKCTGKYYGEKIGTENGVNFDFRYTYELREDGTYSVNYSDVQGADGKYVIIGNSVCFAEPLEIVGPGDYPHYNAYCSYIKDDCSSILKTLSDTGERMELKKAD